MCEPQSKHRMARDKVRATKWCKRAKMFMSKGWSNGQISEFVRALLHAFRCLSMRAHTVGDIHVSQNGQRVHGAHRGQV